MGSGFLEEVLAIPEYQGPRQTLRPSLQGWSLSPWVNHLICKMDIVTLCKLRAGQHHFCWAVVQVCNEHCVWLCERSAGHGRESQSLGLLSPGASLPSYFFLFYLLNHQFIVKGYNSDTTRWKGYIGQGMWKRAQSFPGLRHSTLPTSPRVHQSGSSLLFLPEKLHIPQYSQHR